MVGVPRSDDRMNCTGSNADYQESQTAIIACNKIIAKYDSCTAVHQRRLALVANGYVTVTPRGRFDQRWLGVSALTEG